jgi:HEAT repeat protein
MRTAPALLLLAAAALAGPPAASGAQAAPSFEEAQRLLGAASWQDRIQGLEMLEGLKSDTRAEKAAVKALEDADWGVILRAAGALGKIGTEQSRDALLKVAVDGEIAWIRDAATQALKTVDPKGAASRLVGAARSMKEPARQARAIEAAGRQNVAETMKALPGLAESREAEVTAAAIRAVGELGAAVPEVRKEAVDILRRVLLLRSERKHFFAYAAAVEGLGRIVLPESTQALVDEVPKLADDDGYVPERIARGLAFDGRTDAAAAVRKALEKEKAVPVLRRFARIATRAGLKDLAPEMARLLANPDERVRSEAAKALGTFADASSAEALRGLLQDKGPFARREAVTSLARVLPLPEFLALGPALAGDADPLVTLQFVVELSDRNDPAALPALAALFTHASWRVSSAALAAYGAIGVAADLPPLEAPSGHKDWKVRAAAFEAMGRLRAKEAIPRLVEGLKDRDPVVKGACLANLQILTKQGMAADPAAWAAWWEKNAPSLAFVKRSRRTAAEIETEKKEEDRYGASMYGRRKGVEILQKARILVVSGAWDHVEKVLGHLKIPHTLLRAQQIKEAGLNPNQVLLVNCEGNLDEDSVGRVQWFVNVGGYAMTTDWALTKAVRLCFPGYGEQFAGANTGNDVVVVEEAMPGHPFTAGIFANVPSMKWWLEIQAFPIRVAYPERCDVLVDSAEMRRRYGSSPLALAFRWGLGKVQHSVSHFALQEEGMTQARGERQRMIFAADHLGLSLEAIRDLAKKGSFTGQLNEETMKEIAPDYSMFRLIVNVVAEKSKWVEDL